MARREVVVRQGDLFWVTFASGRGSAPWGRRPALVLQHDRFNASRLNTVVVVAITSNLRYESLPGNVRLRKGDGGMPKASVVNVTQIQTIDRAFLLDKIGSLPRRLLQRVWKGVCLVAEVEN